MNELNNTLFALLRSVICDERIDESVKNDLDSERIENIYKLLKKHDMAHLLVAAIDKCGVALDGEIASKITKKQFMAIYRYENINYELSRIKNTLEEAGIDYIPLKGAVIRELYPEPWMRTSSDIDVLVRVSDHERATDVICEKLGYMLREKESKHDVSLYSESGVHLELHYSICEGIDLPDTYLSRVWEYAYCVGESHEYNLKNEFFVFYLVIHALCHFTIGGCGLRAICDLYLCKNKMGYDEGEVISLCRATNTETFYCELMSLAEVWFGGGERREITDSLEKYILFGGIFGTTASHIAVRRTVEGGKLKFAGKRIFAPYKTLKARYPSLKCPLLVPAYQVKRWIDVWRLGRGAESLSELKTNSYIDNKKVAEINSLLIDLKIKEHIK